MCHISWAYNKCFCVICLHHWKPGINKLHSPRNSSDWNMNAVQGAQVKYCSDFANLQENETAIK